MARAVAQTEGLVKARAQRGDGTVSDVAHGVKFDVFRDGQ